MNVQILADVSDAIRVVLERSVVESAGFFAEETWLEQYVDAMETCGTDRNDLSVWELKGFLLVGLRRRFEPSVVIHATVAQFLFNIPSTLPLSGGSEGVSLLKMVIHEILFKITASHAKDGVMQSVTLGEGHCVRRTRLPRNGNVRRDSDDVFVWEHVGPLLVNFRSRFVLCVVT